MRSFPTRALPAAALVVAAGLGGFYAHRLLVAPASAIATASAPAPQSSDKSPVDDVDLIARGTVDSGDRPAPAHAIAGTLPDIAFSDRLGVERRFSHWQGHPLLVNFWATWCGPCRQEIPLLERLSRERAAQGLQIIGVAVDSRAAVLDYARRAAIQYPLLIGQRPGLEAVQALGMEAAFPFSVFVDTHGRIVTLKIGRLRADQAALILDRLDDLDRGRIDLATARREISAGMAKLAVTQAQEAPSAKL